METDYLYEYLIINVIKYNLNPYQLYNAIGLKKGRNIEFIRLIVYCILATLNGTGSFIAEHKRLVCNGICDICLNPNVDTRKYIC